MLARAFDDSPLFEFLFPKGPARLKITAGTFRGTLIDALPFGAVHVATDDTGVIGLACWLPPEGYPITPRRQALMLARIARLVPWAPTRVPDSMRYLNATEKVHPKDLHWYLSLLGVDPRRQGEGLGGRLVDHTLDPARPRGHPRVPRDRQGVEPRLVRPAPLRAARDAPPGPGRPPGLDHVARPRLTPDPPRPRFWRRLPTHRVGK